MVVKLVLFFFRNLRTTLYIGSTVLVKGHLNNDVETSVLRAGRIIAFNHTYDNEYLVDILLYVPFSASIVSKFENIITEFPLKDMIELVMTNEVISVYESSIYDVSFIFSVDDVLSGHALCHGIINSFVSRFELEYNNNYYRTIIQNDTSLVFPSLASSFEFGDSCHHQRIFNGITKIQDKMSNLLNRGTQKQMEYHLHKEYLTINQELWVYITTRCSTLTKPIVTQGKNRVKRLAVFNDLSRHTFGMHCDIYLLQFETVTQLHCFCRILGNNNLVGLRQHKPKLGKTSSVYDENVMNILIGNSTRVFSSNHYQYYLVV